MKKLFCIFLSLMLFANIFSNLDEFSEKDLKNYVKKILEIEISEDSFSSIKHCNTRLLLIMHEIKKKYIQFFHEKLKGRLIPIVAECLEDFFLTKDMVCFESQQKEAVTEKEVNQLNFIMTKERLLLASSSNDLDQKLSNWHNEFIRLMASIRASFDCAVAVRALDKIEFDDEESMATKELKGEVFLKLAEVFVGYKSDERKIKEINKLKKNVDYLKKVLNPA